MEWAEPQIDALTRAAFATADCGKSDGELSANEMKTYLPGTPFRWFGDWLCRKRPPMGTPYYQTFAGRQGTLTVEQLRQRDKEQQAQLSEGLRTLAS